MKHPTLEEELSGHNVTKLGVKEGRSAQISDIRFIWKVEGKHTGYQFGVYQMALSPGAGIPLHKHVYPEFYYVTEGKLDVARINDEEQVEWLTCAAGESAIVPPNAPHTWRNSGSEVVKFLNMSTYYHELTLNAGSKDVNIDDPLPTAPDAAEYARFGEASAKNQAYYIEL